MCCQPGFTVCGRRCVCACLHVQCMWAYLCGSACTHTHWRPEKKIYQVSFSITLYLMYWSRISHLDPKLATLASLAGQLALGIPCLHLLCDWSTRRWHAHLVFTWVLRIQTLLSHFSHAGMVNALSAEPSPQSLTLDSWWNTWQHGTPLRP